MKGWATWLKNFRCWRNSTYSGYEYDKFDYSDTSDRNIWRFWWRPCIWSCWWILSFILGIWHLHAFHSSWICTCVLLQHVKHLFFAFPLFLFYFTCYLDESDWFRVFVSLGSLKNRFSFPNYIFYSVFCWFRGFVIFH